VVGLVPMVMVDRDCAERPPRPSKHININQLLRFMKLRFSSLHSQPFLR
jgi:hypothetical protein